MKKLTLVLGLFFLAVALLFVLAAWFEAWSVHRKEVDRRRLVWGPEAEVPFFDPTTAFLPARMPEDTKTFYVFAAPCAAAGVLFMFLWWIAQPRGKSEKASIHEI
jgi:hypothetical protein